MDKILEINDVRKFFGRKEILRGINFSVEEGEIISVLGPSGCGKSGFSGFCPLASYESKGKYFVRAEGEKTGKRGNGEPS